MKNSLSVLKRICVSLVLFVTGSVIAHAEPPVAPPEDFVKASIMVAEPGEKLYSAAGHAFFRMQCPSAGMDFCFSYESEDVAEKVLTFLAGNLKMGLAAFNTSDYINTYRNENRSVTEYPLNLPIAMKQELWRVLDNHVDEGMELPYDYMERGCAISVLHILEEAMGSEVPEYNCIAPAFRKTRREILTSELETRPWTAFALNVLTNGSANSEVIDKEKVVTPSLLVTMLLDSKLRGVNILSPGNTVVAGNNRTESRGWFTPIFITGIILALTIGLSLAGKSIMLRLLIGFQLILGLLNVYLVFFSSLCATEWSWLLIPFNPLPAIFWKWRRFWELPYAVVILIWSAVMALVPHSLTDPSLVIVALSVSISYAADKLLPQGLLVPGEQGNNSKKISFSHFKIKPINL